MGKNGKSMAVPRLRFPEFREEGGWEQSKLGSFATILKGKGVAKSDIDPCGAHPCIRYGELYTHYGEIVETVHSRTNVPVSDLFLSRKNDVIIPASGETKLDIATATCVLHDDVALGSDLNVLRTNHNGVFLSYLLNGSKRHEIARVAQGDTIAHLYPSQLQEIALSMPSQAEQRKIAGCLTSLDEVIAAQGRKVEALKAQKRGLMQQLFPREGETAPRLRFLEFRKGSRWTSVELGQLAEIITKQVGTTECVPYTVTTGVGLVSQQEKFGRTITGSSFKNYIVLRKNDFAYNKSATKAFPQGFIARYAGDEYAAVPNSIFTCFRVNEKTINPVYLGYLFSFNLHGKWLRKYITIGARVHGSLNVSSDDLMALPIPLPDRTMPIKEQQKISGCLSFLDVQITAESEKLNALRFHKKGLMQQLFPSPEDAKT